MLLVHCILCGSKFQVSKETEGNIKTMRPIESSDVVCRNCVCEVFTDSDPEEEMWEKFERSFTELQPRQKSNLGGEDFLEKFNAFCVFEDEEVLYCEPTVFEKTEDAGWVETVYGDGLDKECTYGYTDQDALAEELLRNGVVEVHSKSTYFLVRE